MSDVILTQIEGSPLESGDYWTVHREIEKLREFFEFQAKEVGAIGTQAGVNASDNFYVRAIALCDHASWLHKELQMLRVESDQMCDYYIILLQEALDGLRAELSCEEETELVERLTVVVQNYYGEEQ